MAEAPPKPPKITRDMLCVPVPDAAFEDVTQLFYVGSSPRDNVSLASMASLDTQQQGHRTSRVDSVALEMDDGEESVAPEERRYVTKDAFVVCSNDNNDGDDDNDDDCFQERSDSTATIVVPITPGVSEMGAATPLSAATERTEPPDPEAPQKLLEKLDSSELLSRSLSRQSNSMDSPVPPPESPEKKEGVRRRGSEGSGYINWDRVLPETMVLSGVAREPLPCPSVSDQPPRHDNKPGGPPGPALDRLQSTVSGTSTVFGSEDHTCRICWWGEEREACIQPCRCSGSSAYVHASCLQKWLHVTSVYHCEICTFAFKTRKRTKPVSQWTWRVSKTRQVSQLEATLILLSIVTPPLVCGIVLCSQKISDYIANDEHAWKTAALLTLILASIITYLVAVVYFCRKVSIVCKTWISLNQKLVVTLANSNLEIEVPALEGQPHVWTIT